jgi:hypothetical protein
LHRDAILHCTTVEQLGAEIIAVGGMPNRNSRSA